MKRILICTFCAVLLLTACDTDLNGPTGNSRGTADMAGFYLGFDSKTSGKDKDGNDREQDGFNMLKTVEDFDRADGELIIDPDGGNRQTAELPEIEKHNILEYNDKKQRFYVKVMPEDAYISGARLFSSDSLITVVKNAKDGFFAFDVSFKDVGYSDLTLEVDTKVDGKAATVVKVYPMKTVATMDFKLKVNKFWKKGTRNARIRYVCKKLPPGERKIYMELQDSVMVVGRCEYYDYANDHMNTLHTVYDTITYPLHKRYEPIRRGKRALLRNVSTAVAAMNSQKDFKGQYLVTPQYAEAWYSHLADTTVLPEGWRDILREKGSILVNEKYPFYCYNVNLHFNVIFDNEFMQYNVSATVSPECESVIDSLRKDGTFEEIHVDLEDDYDYDDDDYEPSQAELDTLKQYFTYQFNDFLTLHERDSVMNKFRNELTEARKDSLDLEYSNYNNRK